MRKLARKILATATICTMAFMMVACGKGEDSSKLPTAQTVTDTPSNDTKDVDNKEVVNKEVDNKDADNKDADNKEVIITDVDNTPDTDKVVSDLPKAITAVTKISVPDILYTGWNIISIEVDGVKVSDDDFYTRMEKEYDGYFDFIFNSETETMLGTRNNYYMGTYTAEEDNVLHVVFDDFAYYAAFTMMEGTETLVLVDTAAPETTLYLWQMDEK